MVLSVKTKLKIFVAVIVLLIIAIGGSFAYFNYYIKTPQYALNAVESAVKNHDIDEFNKYVDTDSLVSGVTDDMLNGIILEQEGLPEEAKAAMNNMATMFKAPLIASLNEGLNTFVKTGSWQTGDTTKDSQGAMINSDMILEQTGLSGLSFDSIDYIHVDEANGTAEAGIKATQSEINQQFTFNITLQKQDDGYWKVEKITNFADFMKVLSDARKQEVANYIDQTNQLLLDKEKSITESETQLNAALSLNVLGKDDSRQEIKAQIENEVLPQLQDLYSSLQGLDVPKAAQTLHSIRLKALENKIAYYQNYAKWLDNKDINTLRSATDSLKKAKTMESEANALTKRIQGQITK